MDKGKEMPFGYRPGARVNSKGEAAPVGVEPADVGVEEFTHRWLIWTGIVGLLFTFLLAPYSIRLLDPGLFGTAPGVINVTLRSGVELKEPLTLIVSTVGENAASRTNEEQPKPTMFTERDLQEFVAEVSVEWPNPSLPCRTYPLSYGSIVEPRWRPAGGLLDNAACQSLIIPVAIGKATREYRLPQVRVLSSSRKPSSVAPRVEYRIYPPPSYQPAEGVALDLKKVPEGWSYSSDGKQPISLRFADGTKALSLGRSAWLLAFATALSTNLFMLGLPSMIRSFHGSRDPQSPKGSSIATLGALLAVMSSPFFGAGGIRTGWLIGAGTLFLTLTILQWTGRISLLGRGMPSLPQVFVAYAFAVVGTFAVNEKFNKFPRTQDGIRSALVAGMTVVAVSYFVAVIAVWIGRSFGVIETLVFVVLLTCGEHLLLGKSLLFLTSWLVPTLIVSLHLERAPVTSGPFRAAVTNWLPMASLFSIFQGYLLLSIVPGGG